MIPDVERFRLVKKMFEVYATGNYSLKDTRNLLAQKGLLSKNDKVLSISNTQMILNNPFYYGMFKYGGELHQGKHEPMISKKLFDKCQEVMARNAHPMKRGIIKPCFSRNIFVRRMRLWYYQRSTKRSYLLSLHQKERYLRTKIYPRRIPRRTSK